MWTGTGCALQVNYATDYSNNHKRFYGYSQKIPLHAKPYDPRYDGKDKDKIIREKDAELKQFGAGRRDAGSLAGTTTSAAAATATTTALGAGKVGPLACGRSIPAPTVTHVCAWHCDPLTCAGLCHGCADLSTSRACSTDAGAKTSGDPVAATKKIPSEVPHGRACRRERAEHAECHRRRICH